LNYSSILNQKNILITGGTGSFGHQMILELMQYKPKLIRILSRDEDKQHELKQELLDNPILDKIQFMIGDVRDYERVHSVTKNINIVFHAAALKQVPSVEAHPYEAVKTNIVGAYNVVRASVAQQVKNVVAISTDKAVKPVNAMGMTKALQEKLILSDEITKNKTIFCCVRYGNVLGSRGSVIPLWDKRLEKNKPLPITHPEMTRFTLTLSQAIDLVFYSLKHSKGGEIFVKKAPATKMVNLARAYAELKTGEKNYPLEYIGIRAGEKIHEVLVSEEEMRHAVEKKDHYIINREAVIDKKFNKKSTKFEEYDSENTTHLDIEELKILMKKLKWVV
jgi:UDP-N-acetylglucosamine 4,6-dehydratase